MKHALLLLLLSAPAAAQTADFDPAWIAHELTTYPDGIEPWPSVLADLDGDGRMDLATASWDATPQPRLALSFGDGKGGFDAPLVHTTVLTSLGLAAADLDGDGDLDLAVAETGKEMDGASVAVWRNLGARTFAYAGSYATGPGPVGVAAADLDLDGDVDLAVARDLAIVSGNQLAVLLNTGAGAFGPPSILTLPGSAYQVAAGDLNGDGRPDLVVGGEMRDVTVLLGLPSGFAPGVRYAMASTFYQDQYPTLELFDVDGDGDLDVLTSAEQIFGPDTGTVGLRRNQGNGTLLALEQLPLVPGKEGAVDLALADVTGDGDADLLAAVEWGGFWALLPGDGTGSFGAAAHYRAAAGPHAIHGNDQDGDGDADVIVVSGSSLSAAVFENGGGGAFPQPVSFDLIDPAKAPVSFSESAASDLDQDGDLDVVVGTSANFLPEYALSVTHGNGDGTFSAPQFYPTSRLAAFLALADVDGDGWDDVVYVEDDYTSRLRWRLNQRDGTFGAAQAGPQLCWNVVAFAVLDVDGDLDPDVVANGCPFDAKISLNTGGTYGPFKTHVLGDYLTAIAGGDLDEDGDLDLVTNSGIQGWPEVSLGNGDGTFQPPFTVQGGFGVEAIVLADFDGDSFLDMATHDQLGESMTVLIGRGDGSFKPPKKYAAAYDDTRSLVAGDADGDGDVDLLAPNPAAKDLSLWRNQGASFAQHERLGVGHPPADLELADFDGDGVPDVLALVEPNFTGWYYPGLVLMKGQAGAAWSDLGQSLPGTLGAPQLTGAGLLAPGTPITLSLTSALPGTVGAHVVGAGQLGLPFAGGTLVPSLTILFPFTTGAAGTTLYSQAFPPGIAPGASLWFQSWMLDAGAVQGFAASNALVATTP